MQSKISLSNYIIESWSGVKKHTNNANIESWCDEMGIKDYTINSKGEIDVDGGVNLSHNTFKELPYKFGNVGGNFLLSYCKNLISLKNCPNHVGDSFGCSGCIKLNSLEGCPSYVVWNFYCSECKRKFTIEEVKSLCEVKKDIWC